MDQDKTDGDLPQASASEQVKEGERARCTIAIVIPIYNEQQILPELHRRLCALFQRQDDVDWQVIFVNDGSEDDSGRIIREVALNDARFGLVDLSRNFGHQAAISAGLAHADADAIVVMDGDLQDPPEIIPELVECWRQGAKVVVPTKRSRRDTAIRLLGFGLFHRIFQWMSVVPIQRNAGVFGLMDRKVVEVFNKLPERNRFIPGLRSWIGFEQRSVPYDREERLTGAPKQTLWRLFKLAADGVLSFSLRPLRFMTLSGIGISSLGFVLACVFIIKRLTGAEVAATGFTTLVTLVLFLGGIQLIALGVLGEYLGRIYDEAKQRPLYVVRARYGVEEKVAELE